MVGHLSRLSDRWLIWLFLDHPLITVLPWRTPIFWREREEEGLTLCLALGLLYSTLQKIEKGYGKADDCMMEMLAACLQQQGMVSQYAWCPILEWVCCKQHLIGENELADTVPSTTQWWVESRWLSVCVCVCVCVCLWFNYQSCMLHRTEWARVSYTVSNTSNTELTEW